MSTIVIDRVADIVINPRIRPSRKLSAWHPSSASVQYYDEYEELVTVGSCLRRQYYERTGTPETGVSTLNGLMKAQAGDLWSQWLVDRIKESGFWYGDEVSFYDQELNLKGRIDVMVAEEGTGKPIGVEIKSTGTFLSSGVIKPTGTKPLAPKEEHTLQVMLYLYHYSKFGVDKWVLLYLDRDAMNMREHIVRFGTNDDGTHYPIISNDMGTLEWTHIRLEDIIQRWQKLAQHLKDKEVPDREFLDSYPNSKLVQLFHRNKLSKTDRNKVGSKLQKGPLTDDMPPIISKGDWQCAYCPFYQTCYQDTPQSGPIHPDQANAEL